MNASTRMPSENYKHRDSQSCPLISVYGQVWLQIGYWSRTFRIKGNTAWSGIAKVIERGCRQFRAILHVLLSQVEKIWELSLTTWTTPSRVRSFLGPNAIRTSRKQTLPWLSVVANRFSIKGWYWTSVTSFSSWIVPWALVIRRSVRSSWSSTRPSSLEGVTHQN